MLQGKKVSEVEKVCFFSLLIKYWGLWLFSIQLLFHCKYPLQSNKILNIKVTTFTCEHFCLLTVSHSWSLTVEHFCSGTFEHSCFCSVRHFCSFTVLHCFLFSVLHSWSLTVLHTSLHSGSRKHCPVFVGDLTRVQSFPDSAGRPRAHWRIRMNTTT